ncbi:MAG: hypothetical protein KAT32_05100, partial [Candidatus Moranbacteria bacterium]|nr:hypothetical protein [Candidatus Moranbacteria bacterium]
MKKITSLFLIAGIFYFIGGIAYAEVPNQGGLALFSKNVGGGENFSADIIVPLGAVLDYSYDADKVDKPSKYSVGLNVDAFSGQNLFGIYTVTDGYSDKFRPLIGVSGGTDGSFYGRLGVTINLPLSNELSAYLDPSIYFGSSDEDGQNFLFEGFVVIQRKLNSDNAVNFELGYKGFQEKIVFGPSISNSSIFGNPIKVFAGGECGDEECGFSGGVELGFFFWYCYQN